ncbi:hypothetical protein ASPWEDRAFT_109605 [Aspergillus wentii DTO 134E9]|uniref:feruloyl esterase n=1 Tax=Aspergillus wentii DTO 134E9 TaxID=1073089 RepID=A0A1L9RM36_ASPWE|nr:uncharacterized protein ASPWEDRAFT_109605 [Aspergillus wentii DTO 134E9]OJJ35897.1 hypothetical protein ASPWEDRAFT_109605 [Aspergillus wentii DTO 134E9]
MFDILFGIIASLLLVQAAPSPVLFTKADVDSSVLNNLDLFAQYSAASYCLENLNSSNTKLECSVGNCPLVEAASTVTLDEFDESSSFGDVTGFIAADETNKLLVLSFRGSSDIANWIADLDFGLTDGSDLCSGCKVHSGFWEAWGTVSDNITSIIESATAKYPNYELAFTGHSYGAALAAVAAVVFRNSGYTVQLYNYGQPRIGNLALADYITNVTDKGDNYRVTHTDDIVPKLPPKLLGYHHASPEYWITSGNNVTVTTADVDVVTGVDSTDGNDGTTADSRTAHRWYFGYISECSTLY